MRRRCSVLLTGFEPFGELRRNPSGDLARLLGRDPAIRSLGVRVGILPVHRHGAPRRLLELLDRWRPRTLILTGVAAGRSAISVERVAINCYRRAGDRGEGRPIRAGGADGLFATLPLGPAARLLSQPGAPAAISESAGTFTCNLVLYTALDACRCGGPGVVLPERVGFIHLPATPECLPAGDPRPSQPLGVQARALTRLLRAEARIGSR